MLEVTIYKYLNENKIRYSSDKTKSWIGLATIPTEIVSSCNTIMDYFSSLKTEEEIQAELAAARIENIFDFISANATDEQKLAMINDYPEWVPSGKLYIVGKEFQYNGKLYKTIQEHTSQPDWVPGTVPALYTEIAPPGVIPDWVQPTGAQDAYNIGDKVRFEGHVYESVIDANVWSPTAHPVGWTLIE